MSSSSNVKTIALHYDASNSESSARKLVFDLNPEWELSPGPVEFVRFKEGITNTLFKAIKKRPGYTEHQIDQEAILLRAYGNGTDVLIDREREARSHSLLSRYSLAPELLARFHNGLLYRFIEGVACTPDDLRRPDVWPSTASRLGQWHAILPVSEAVAGSTKADHKYENINQLIPGKPIPNVWTVLQKWIKALPQETDAEKERQQTLQRELEWSVKMLGNTSSLSNGNYVLSHTDLLCGNVIMHKDGPDSEEQTVSFIDYEYTTPAPQAFDLANHFAEWIGLDCDMNNIPTTREREVFVEAYVKSFNEHKHSSQRTDGRAHADSDLNVHTGVQDVERLMEEVDLFRGMPGLYWGTWAIIQSMISSIDFDYTKYAETRLGEYWAWKAEFDSSRKKSGRDMPLRERRWAS